MDNSCFSFFQRERGYLGMKHFPTAKIKHNCSIVCIEQGYELIFQSDESVFCYHNVSHGIILPFRTRTCIPLAWNLYLNDGNEIFCYFIFVPWNKIKDPIVEPSSCSKIYLNSYLNSKLVGVITVERKIFFIVYIYVLFYINISE